MSSHQRRAGLLAPGPTTGTPSTAQVVRSDASGVWVAVVGTDTRYPIGPCRGATRPALATDSEVDGSPVVLVWEQLPTGTVVLLVQTADGPWVAAHDQPAT